MLSSWQIAQQHAQQGQMFGAQQAYSQQLSAGMPPPYQGFGLGAQGFGGGFGSGPGPGYSYGGGAASYGGGNSFANAGVSMLGGVGNAFFGSMGAVGGIAGGLMGGQRGGMVGAGLGFFAGSTAGAVGQHVVNSFMEGAQEQGSIERTLSQFQFQNGQSRTGRGFSRSDSMQIGNMVRQMEGVPQMLTSFGELNRLMDKMGQMGLMQGVKDAGEFMSKFRSTVTTLKDLSKLIGTTMEGALQAFGEARTSGFYSSGDIVKNVLNRQITGSLTGMNQDQVGQIQQYGASIGHGTGGSRRTGATNALRTAGQLGMANQMGILTNDQIMEMTGKEGAEGIQDLSAQMTQLSYRMGSSNVGQAMALALGKQEGGRYTGEMDQDLVDRVRRGDLGVDELKSMARRKAGTRGAKLSFAAHKNRIRSEMAGSVGAEGVGMELQEILGDRGWHNPDATNLVMQRFGASEEQANMLQKLMPNLDEIGINMRSQGSSMARRQAEQSIIKERYSSDAIKQKIFKKIDSVISDPFKEAGANVRDYLASTYEDFMDQVTGEYTRDLTKGTSALVRNAMMGNRSAQGRISKMVQDAKTSGAYYRGGSLGIVGADVSSTLAKGLSYLSGTSTAGDQLQSLVGIIAPDELESGHYTEDSLKNSGATILGESYTQNKTYLDRGAMGRMEKSIGAYFDDNKGSQQFVAKYGGDVMNKGTTALQAAIARGEIDSSADSETRVRQMGAVIRKAVGDDTYKKMSRLSGQDGVSDSYVVAQFSKDPKMKGFIATNNLRKDLLDKLRGFDNSGSQADLAKKSADLRGDLAKSFKNTGGMSYAEIDKWMNEDSTFKKLVLGDDKTAGLSEIVSNPLVDFGRKGDHDSDIALMPIGGENAQRAFTLASGRGNSGMAIATALEKDATSWNDDDVAAMSKLGVTKEWATKNQDKLREAKKALAQQDPGWLNKLGAVSSNSNAQEVLEIKRQFREAGSRMSDVMDRYKGQAGKLGKGGQSAMSAIGDLVKMMGEGDLDKLGGMGSKMQDIIGLVEGASKGDQKVLKSMLGESGFDELSGTISQYEHVMRKGKRLGKKGMDLHKFIGEDAFGHDDNADAEWKDLESKFGKTANKGNLSALAKELATGKGADLMAKAGSERTSSFISEQQIADSLKTMSDNAAKTATILQTLVPNGGTPPADGK